MKIVDTNFTRYKRKEVVDIEAKDYIIKKFYDEHEKPSVIAKELEFRPSYVTKIIQKDMRRYNSEKEYRDKIQKEKRKKDKRDWARKSRESKKELDDFMEMQHRQATEELSYKPELSDLAYAEWNRSAFGYENKTSGLKLRSGINAGFAVAKKIRKVIDPSFVKSKKIYV